MRRASPCRGLAGSAQQRLHLRLGQRRWPQPLANGEEAQLGRHVRLHPAALARPAEEFLERLDLAIDGSCLQPLGADEVLAVIDQVDGRDARQRHRDAVGFDPAAEALEVMAVAADGHRRKVLLGQPAGEGLEQRLPQGGGRPSY